MRKEDSRYTVTAAMVKKAAKLKVSGPSYTKLASTSGSSGRSLP